MANCKYIAASFIFSFFPNPNFDYTRNDFITVPACQFWLLRPLSDEHVDSEQLDIASYNVRNSGADILDLLEL